MKCGGIRGGASRPCWEAGWRLRRAPCHRSSRGRRSHAVHGLAAPGTFGGVVRWGLIGLRMAHVRRLSASPVSCRARRRKPSLRCESRHRSVEPARRVFGVGALRSALPCLRLRPRCRIGPGAGGHQSPELRALGRVGTRPARLDSVRCRLGWASSRAGGRVTSSSMEASPMRVQDASQRTATGPLPSAGRAPHAQSLGSHRDGDDDVLVVATRADEAALVPG